MNTEYQSSSYVCDVLYSHVLHMYVCVDVHMPVLILGSMKSLCVQHRLEGVVEAHCYVVDIGRTDREQIRSRINNN